MRMVTIMAGDHFTDGGFGNRFNTMAEINEQTMEVEFIH